MNLEVNVHIEMINSTPCLPSNGEVDLVHCKTFDFIPYNLDE
jgi:hypothetical protein